MWRKTIFYMADRIFTPCNVVRLWHRYRESWQWSHQVTTPCNVIRGSGMTSHWILSNIMESYIWFQFRPNHRSRHAILQQSPIFFQIGPASAEEMDVRDPIMDSLKSTPSAVHYANRRFAHQSHYADRPTTMWRLWTVGQGDLIEPKSRGS